MDIWTKTSLSKNQWPTSSTSKPLLEIRLEPASPFTTRSRREGDPQAHLDIASPGGGERWRVQLTVSGTAGEHLGIKTGDARSGESRTESNQGLRLVSTVMRSAVCQQESHPLWQPQATDIQRQSHEGHLRESDRSPYRMKLVRADSQV